jgi:4-hydroxy-tetrahydrodipicolinate synthase
MTIAPSAAHESTSTESSAPLVRGVSPVLLTPFTDEGEVDYDSFRRVVRYVCGTGVQSVMYPGFAGEFYKLAEDERVKLTEVLIEEVRAFPGVAVIAAVQDHATILAAKRAKWSVDVGAHVINLLPPYLLQPSMAAIEAHIREVLAAVPSTPVVLQYAPTETGTSLSSESLAAIARDHSNLALVKVESSPPGPFIAELAALEPPILSLEGYAGVQLPDAIRRGAVGTQPGCSFTELYVEIWRGYAEGEADAAYRLHSQLLPYISYWMLHTETINAAEKLIAFKRGLIASAYCRQPAHVLDHAEIATVDRFLAEFAPSLPHLGD